MVACPANNRAIAKTPSAKWPVGRRPRSGKRPRLAKQRKNLSICLSKRRVSYRGSKINLCKQTNCRRSSSFYSRAFLVKNGFDPCCSRSKRYGREYASHEDGAPWNYRGQMGCAAVTGLPGMRRSHRGLRHAATGLYTMIEASREAFTRSTIVSYADFCRDPRAFETKIMDMTGLGHAPHPPKLIFSKSTHSTSLTDTVSRTLGRDLFKKT